MLTGRLAFGASTSADTIAAVIERDADWSALPRDVPPSIARMLRRCLRRDPSTRLRDMGDARLELDEASPAEEAPRVTDGRRRIPVIAIAGLLATGAVFGALATAARRAPVPDNATPAHFVMSLPQSAPLGGVDFPSVAMAPDGTRLVYVANRGDQTQLFVRSMDAVDPTPMAGTTHAVSPFFSPDGHWIAFFADGQLKKVAVAGGAPITLCPAPVGLGGSWSRDDVIVFAAATGSGLSQIPASGGTPRPLTTLNVAQGEFSHRWPEWLPDGETVLYTVGTSGSWNEAQIAAYSVRTGQRSTLVRGGTNAHYLAPGALIYGQRGRIMSVPFDEHRVTITGKPTVVLENVLQSSDGAVQFSASRSGSAVFVGGASDESQRRLVAVGRDGTNAPFAAPPGPYASPRSSPDGRRLLVTLEAPNPDLWVYDVMTGTSTQVTFDSGAASPVWSPDGQQLAFSSTRAGVPNLFVTSISRSGPIERLAASENQQSPGSWAPDGTIAYVERRVKTGRDVLFVTARDRTPRTFLDSTADESAPAFSPDGRWLAYVSTESGRNEVYVKSPSRPDRPRRASTDGGSEPVWSRDGRDLFYREGPKMMRVAVASTDQAVQPQVLFDGDFARGTIDSPNYDVMPDGRFVMVQRPMQSAGPDVLHVLLNWSRALAAESLR
jgi:serine/threonine-protein kinase